ncbi:hypothetical protein EDD66_103397 [Mobilisporobacter senegalensis]|uniref:Uncharacterized protein n=1 Tax=Mobilisporobacter senegalensis TaxID=1329262 RepID=A0A3N1XS32_9FIRM|nr:hypothetical protein [Mobilisporobacter senegalensis]ROR29459.1 hypothetical protein EDD66_103397 [Mobilisporobacter senegalensis]
MNIKMDSILKEINNGKNLEMNLPRFSQRLMNDYYEYALVRLVMNYFTFYEVVRDKENPQIKNVKSIMKSIHSIMKDAYLSQFNGELIEDSVRKLDGSRLEIMKKMEILTAYTDTLQIYEYVLNRLELKYETTIPDIDNETAVKEIFNFIFAVKDNIIINDRMKEVIGQLPIRMAKTKYFTILSDSLSIYKGSDKSSVENYLYILKASSMLYSPEGIEEEFSDLISLKEELETADYRNLEHKTYKSLCKKLNKGAEFIRYMTDIYIQLEEIINNLYVVLLASPYVDQTDEKTEEACKNILSELNHNFMDNNFDEDIKPLVEMLEMIEGKQEEIGFHVVKYEGFLHDIKERHTPFIHSIMLGKIYSSLYTCQKLLSTSLFIDINKNDTEELADDKYITTVTEDFILELKESFKQKNQLVTRAIMANTLNKMPVFFHSSNEVLEYIMNSISSCNNEAEKAASINIIRQLMESI